MLEEWLLWHLVLGVTKILVYDNNSQDQDGLLAVLRPFIKAGAVELVPWPAHASQTTVSDHHSNVGSAPPTAHPTTPLATDPAFESCSDL